MKQIVCRLGIAVMLSAAVTSNVPAQVLDIPNPAPPIPNILGPAPTHTLYLTAMMGGGISFPIKAVSPGSTFGMAPEYLLGATAFFISTVGILSRTLLFANVAFESRGFGFSSNSSTGDARVNYLSVMPGFCYRGILNFGLNIGFPIHASTSLDVSSTQRLVSNIDLNSTHLLIEPKIIFGYGWRYSWFGGAGVAIYVMAGYPLTRTFSGSTIVHDMNGNAITDPSLIHMPTLQLGVLWGLGDLVQWY